MSQAQEASRDLRPIREEMSTSSRVLRNGMVNLAVDIEEEIEDQLEELADSLAGLNPANQGSESDQLQRAADDAENLREQIESLQQQALAFNDSGRSRARSRVFVTCASSCSAASSWLNSCRTSCVIRRGADSRAHRPGKRELVVIDSKSGVPEEKVSSAPAWVERSTPTATICPGECPFDQAATDPAGHRRFHQSTGVVSSAAPADYRARRCAARSSRTRQHQRQAVRVFR